MDKTSPRPHALYRFFDESGSLLYVGKTVDPGSRWSSHSKEKPWWTEVVSVTVQHFPNAETVEEAEVEAIRNERPRYNIKHNPAAPHRLPERTCVEMSADQIGERFASDGRPVIDQLADVLLDLERAMSGHLDGHLNDLESLGDHESTSWLRQRIRAVLATHLELQPEGATA